MLYNVYVVVFHIFLRLLRNLPLLVNYDEFNMYIVGDAISIRFQFAFLYPLKMCISSISDTFGWLYPLTGYIL